MKTMPAVSIPNRVQYQVFFMRRGAGSQRCPAISEPRDLPGSSVRREVLARSHDCASAVSELDRLVLGDWNGKCDAAAAVVLPGGGRAAVDARGASAIPGAVECHPEAGTERVARVKLNAR